MWVDDRSNDHVLPVNSTATQLYGTGWPILGNAIVVSDDRRPLPPSLLRDLLPDIDDRDLARRSDPEPVALDWEDHHRDRDTWDVEDLLEDDLALMPGPTEADLKLEEDLEFREDLEVGSGSRGLDHDSWEVEPSGGADFDL